jgi:hypothetical protein
MSGDIIGELQVNNIIESTEKIVINMLKGWKRNVSQI